MTKSQVDRIVSLMDSGEFNNLVIGYSMFISNIKSISKLTVKRNLNFRIKLGRDKFYFSYVYNDRYKRKYYWYTFSRELHDTNLNRVFCKSSIPYILQLIRKYLRE